MAITAVPSGAIIHMDAPAEFEIRDGIACCTIHSGGVTIEYRSTIYTARMGAASWAKAEAKHFAGQARAIVKFSKRRH